MRPQPQFPVHPRFRLQSRAGFGVIEEQIVGIAVRIDLGGPKSNRAIVRRAVLGHLNAQLAQKFVRELNSYL